MQDLCREAGLDTHPFRGLRFTPDAMEAAYLYDRHKRDLRMLRLAAGVAFVAMAAWYIPYDYQFIGYKHYPFSWWMHSGIIGSITAIIAGSTLAATQAISRKDETPDYSKAETFKYRRLYQWWLVAGIYAIALANASVSVLFHDATIVAMLGASFSITFLFGVAVGRLSRTPSGVLGILLLVTLLATLWAFLKSSPSEQSALEVQNQIAPLAMSLFLGYYCSFHFSRSGRERWLMTREHALEDLFKTDEMEADELHKNQEDWLEDT